MILCNDCYDWAHEVSGNDFECATPPLINKACFVCGKPTRDKNIDVNPKVFIDLCYYKQPGIKK